MNKKKSFIINVPSWGYPAGLHNDNKDIVKEIHGFHLIELMLYKVTFET